MAPKPAPPPLVVAGPPTAMTVEDRRWADQAEKLELEALTAIRGLAEKWAASLTSALGVVGLAALFQSAGKFDDLDNPWKAIGQICFTLAVLLALVASGLSIAAAQGAAKRVFVPGGLLFASTPRAQWTTPSGISQPLGSWQHWPLWQFSEPPTASGSETERTARPP
jgi:hypothetical protein